MLSTAPNIGPTFRRRRLGHFRDRPAYEDYVQAYGRALAELPRPAQTRDVPTTFGTVRAYRFGPEDGVPLMLLPGRASASPVWEANLAGFACHRPVWAIDLLGEPGMSVQARPLANADHQAAWLAEVLAGLGLEAVHLLGLSIGGWSALNLAARQPGPLASLILLEPAHTFAPISWKVVLASVALVLPAPRPVHRRVLSWIGGGADASEDDPVAALIAAGMRDFTTSLPAPTYPTDEQIAGIDVPVLVAVGGRSVIHNGRKAAERARRLLQRGAVEYWPEASHAINGEFPARLNSRVTEFLAEVDASR